MTHPKANRTALNAQTEDLTIAIQLTSMREFAAQRGWFITAELIPSPKFRKIELGTLTKS